MSDPPHNEADRPGVGARFIAGFALGYVGLWVALLTPSLGTLAIRVRQIDAAHSAELLARVLALGAACALIANPVFGHLSDRTRAAGGMRRPWMLAGVCVGCAGLALVGSAHEMGVLLAGWCVAQVGFNATLAAMVAVLPDQVPSGQRGTVSGMLAVCLPVGQALGSALVSRVAESPWLMLMLPGVLGSAAVLLFAYFLRDRRLTTDAVAHDDLRLALRTMRVQPGALADFAWAWGSRGLLAMTSIVLMSYLPFYLVDRLQRGLGEVAGVDRHVAPAEQHLALVLDGALDLVLAGDARSRVARQEHHADAVLADFRQLHALARHFLAQEAVGDLDQDSGAVAGIDLAPTCTAVLQILEHPQRLLDDAVRWPPFDVNDEADAAGVVLMLGVV